MGVAEIHIIGTGGGYGESIIINLGNDEWIIIDSCVDPNSKECLPLKFLNENGINLDLVVLIICTHWHDDHIQGLSDLLNLCKNSKFSFGQVLDQKKFFEFLSIDFNKAKSNESNSSTVEFNKCIKIIAQRAGDIKYSSSDKLLYTAKVKQSQIDVFALSPSDQSIKNFNLMLASLIDEASISNIKIINQTPNDKSVVILLKLGNHNVLLGADLEVRTEDNVGWLDIVNNSEAVKQIGKSSYFKIPHHGSENGYHDSIWEVLIKENPVSSLTLWRRSIRLPNEEMLDLYKNKSSELYITSALEVSKKPKARSNSITKQIKQNCLSIEEIKFNYGIISSSIDIESEQAIWETTIHGTALKIK